MPTVVQSCRIEPEHAALLSRQAKRRHLEVSTLSSLYLKEKALEEEYPGIGFRDAVGGREAYVLGHRVAVWEVEGVYREAGSIAKAADYFRWPPALGTTIRQVCASSSKRHRRGTGRIFISTTKTQLKPL